MPDIEAALTTYLLAQTGLTALIDRRLHFDELPKDTKYPAVVWFDSSPEIPGHTHDGETDLARPKKQFTIVADDKPSAKAVATQIKAALSDFSGTISGIEVQYIKRLNKMSGLIKVADGMPQKNAIYLEYEINYKRSD